MQKKTETKVKFPDGKETQCLLWGNNAAWICQCGELLGERTAQDEHIDKQIVKCHCGKQYEITRGKNKKRNYNQGKALKVEFLP